MYTSQAPNGRERRKHPRYEIRKSVQVHAQDQVHEGTLRDVSVGGAAVELRAQLAEKSQVRMEIEELGEYPATVVRRISERVVAFEFSINEAMAVRLAARIAVAYLADDNTSEVKFESIEILPSVA